MYRDNVNQKSNIKSFHNFYDPSFWVCFNKHDDGNFLI